MLNDFAGADRAYIAYGYTDLRLGIDGLPPHKWYKKHEYTLGKIPENVPVERIEHRLEAETLACPECGGKLAEIGKEVANKLKIIPAQVVVEHRVYYSYACRRCSRESIETPVVRAPRVKAFLPGSFATPETVAYIMTQKFVTGVLIYRQERELNCCASS